VRHVKQLGRGEGVRVRPGARGSWVDGRLHVSRKVRKPDEWDPPVEVYDPDGPGGIGDEDIEDLNVFTKAVTGNSEDFTDE
jgi:hypothetical protein